ncbi:exo-1,5-alpha-L-arabinofuranobiosidase [Trichodelitschia bisporula]|uniref:Exo-1,5-alpha-L-arabinofuranobiosidase n=1 Tax=Trichodelitschia bisporula TaxID=703511 RepID=A0A6G1HJZ2_9PEZI|nr:exo-1,5-alpha-L-arabinofuranobiosidase [Trichodelitschia bisporula]
MFLRDAFLWCWVAGAASAAAVTSLASPVTIFSPPSSYKIPRVLYARSLLLKEPTNDNRVILATWENYSQEPPWFPIYQSTDLGRTWKEISKVHDQVKGWGLRYQPFLYELEEPIGDFEAGTLLISGSAIPADLSQTWIELYASKDRGRTWKFVSHIVHGGRAIPNNGETPVWEPFLLVHDKKMVVYYSDQRDPKKHGQKLVHQSSKDLINWETLVQDAADPDKEGRPGMPTIAELPNGQFIMTYENCGPLHCRVFYRLANDPTRFDRAKEITLKATDGTIPNGSPYVVWTRAGGPQGTIVVSSGDRSEVFINRNLGAPGSAWIKTATPASKSYTRSLMVMPNENDILIVGGGVLNGTRNSVTAVAIDVSR